MLLATSWGGDIRLASQGQKAPDDAMCWLLAEQQKTPGALLNRPLIEAAVRGFGVVDHALIENRACYDNASHRSIAAINKSSISLARLASTAAPFGSF